MDSQYTLSYFFGFLSGLVLMAGMLLATIAGTDPCGVQ